jgi:hypothetical protein
VNVDGKEGLHAGVDEARLEALKRGLDEELCSKRVVLLVVSDAQVRLRVQLAVQ